MANQDILANLNKPQLEAVTARGSAVMVLAGAGSGKTRVLTRRLAHLISADSLYPNQILAVTFTNKAAKEMRERVMDMLNLDPVTARSLWIGTFHSMGARILRINAEKLGYDSNFIILDTSEQERMIKKLVEDLHFESTYWTPRKLANGFSRWKDDGLGPDDLTTDHVRNSSDLERISSLFNHYQDELRRTNSMDFGDLLAKCLELWQKHPETLDSFRSRFLHVLVDEYQDTNRVQYDWMRQIASAHGNLCVVGDDDQSIYSWRGARLDNILRFEEDFPKTRIIRLEQNYRSSGNILKAASQLINHNTGRMEKTLWTDGESGPQLIRYQAEDGVDEGRFVAQEIFRQCGHGRFGNAAILVRASRQTRAIEEALNRELIPYLVVGGLRFMDRAEVKDAVAYLRLAYSTRDDLAFERIINNPKRKIGPSAMAAISQRAKECNGSLMEGSHHIIAEKRLGPAVRKKLHEFIQMIDEAKQMLEADEHHETVLDFLLDHSGYRESLNNSDREVEKRGNLDELRSLLVQGDDLPGFLERAVLDSDPNSENSNIEENKVVISTLHAAKGLEFPIVFLVGLEENLLPHKMAVEEGDAGLEEERRLLYVGMTRAKEQLYLCHAKRRLLYNRHEPAMPSRFLQELPSETIEVKGMRLSVRSGTGFRPGAALRPPRRNFRKF
ncbi:MAG: UvrD-helicase domain-containing protein [Magnetococcales bacterium]|nr:UvrD-helicase domain-containing protein [Magnetococcales bacterium]